MSTPDLILACIGIVAAYVALLVGLTRLFSCAVDPEEDA